MEIELINSDESVETLTLNLDKTELFGKEATNNVDTESRNSAWASLRKSISASASVWMDPKQLDTMIDTDVVDVETTKAEEAKKNNEVILSTLENINSNIKDLKKEQEAYLLFQGALKSLTLKINDSIKEVNSIKSSIDTNKNSLELNTGLISKLLLHADSSLKEEKQKEVKQETLLLQIKEIDAQVKKLGLTQLDALAKIDNKVGSINTDTISEKLLDLENTFSDTQNTLSSLLQVSSNSVDMLGKNYGIIEELIDICSQTNTILKENHIEQKQIDEDLVKNNRKYLVIQTVILLLSMALLKFLPL